MAEKLTPQQQMVVDDRGGKLLVSAAAGSGKTKVLVDRVLKYITDTDDPANIDEFLMITFTEAAAAELRAKIAAKLSELIAFDPSSRHLQHQMQRLYMAKISTVHSFCKDLLQEYAYRLDIPGDFRVGDENECRQLRQISLDQVLEEAYSGIHENADFQALVDTQGAGRNDGALTDIIMSVYESSRCHIDPDGWLQLCMNNAEASNIEDASESVWGRILIDDLKAFLPQQIDSMQFCMNAIARFPNQEKATAVFAENIALLNQFLSCNTWDEIVALKSADFGKLNFKYKFIDTETTDRVKAVRNACKETLQQKLSRFYDYTKQVIVDLDSCSAAAKGLIQTVRAFDSQYSRMKRTRRILDFNDLEQYTLSLLLGKNRDTVTSVAKEVSMRFRQIMVDEYQDTNAVQDAIFAVLSKDRNNLFMVGDVKQSIYQFRLADPGIFLQKYTEFVPAEDAENGQDRKISLSSNFRSGDAILQGVNDVFRLCMSEQVGGLSYGEAEALNEGVAHIPLGEPEVELHGIITAENEYEEEAEFVAERICQLLDGNSLIRDKEELRPIKPEDIVILLRSPGTMGSYFQYALEARGIPCTCGGSVDMLKMPEIEVLHSLLKVISNPRQDIALASVLLSPVGGFTADELAYIRAGNRDVSLYDSVCTCDLEMCVQFVELLTVLRKKAATVTLPELLSTIFNLTKIDALYSVRENGDIVKSNLLEFYQYAAGYAGQNGRNMDRFLRHLEIMQDKGLSVNRESGIGCVSITSIHKSKGLEYPVVFVSGLSKGFNRKDLNPPVLCHKELGLGLSCVDMSTRVRYPSISKHAITVHKISESLSEELRILYVAMTRARDRLIMTYADKSLEGTLAKIAARSVYSSGSVLCADVKSIGDWILYAALNRTEAGAFFEAAGNPGIASVTKYPWKITLQRSSIFEAEDDVIIADIPGSEKISLDRLRELVNFHYPHIAATISPSKQTATQRKGREKDQEIAQDAAEEMKPNRIWRSATQRSSKMTGKKFGTAVHNVLRFIDYSKCVSASNISHELARLTVEGYISQEDASLIPVEMLSAFFASETGRALTSTDAVVLKEFKFSLLDDGSQYDNALHDEKILLQGVVDCALIEDDGITVIDFKTDYVTEDTIDSLVQHYAMQVQTYAVALSRIYELPVKKKALYFFKLNRFCWL